MTYQKKNYSRAKRKEQVIRQFNIWHHNGDDSPKTMHRIARALGMTPAPTFKAILDEMVMEGKLTVVRMPKSGRWDADHYLVIKSLIREKYSRANRRLVIKHKGSVVDTVNVPNGQMELWS